MAIEKSQLRKLDEYRWLVPRGTKPGMRTDALIYADERLLEPMLADLSIEQAMNVACLPGIVGRSMGMPDMHEGYGFPIGGVAAMDCEQGVVSPGGVGFDINCGVRLLTTSLQKEEVTSRLRHLVDRLFLEIPSGSGSEGQVPCSVPELDEVLERGAAWTVEHGYGEPEDLEFCEASGAMREADPEKVSRHAKQRGRPQLGTLGSGNHFLEIDYVEKIFEPRAAERFGLRLNEIVILIHCGSRGLGHQVCTDFVKVMGEAMPRHGISVPDRQLACVPLHSPEAKDYLAAMAGAANFGWANRQAITHFTRKAFRDVLGQTVRLHMVYDVAHNMAKRERHWFEGKECDVLVHRKGATRSFAADAPDLPAAYCDIGQPVLIPGSMGTASYVLVGAPGAMNETFGSVCHGAGRAMSRTAAKKGRHAKTEMQKLEDQGIIVRAGSRAGMLEEIPEAYKDIDAVIEVVHNAGLAHKVARLRPMGVIKG